MLRRCRWWRKRGRRGPSSWCGRIRRAACRRARRCARRRNRAAPAADSPAGAPCGSRRRTPSAVENAGVGTPILTPWMIALPPGCLILVQRVGEELVEQQILSFGFLSKASLMLPRNTAADDAAAAPHQRDAAQVQVPALIFRGCAQQHVALRIADDLRAVQRAAHVFDELLRSPVDTLRLRALQDFRGRHPLVFQRRQAARKHSFADQRHRHAQIERAEIAVHLPVPFCPAASRILSTIGWPSSSFLAKISAVISIR